MAIKIHDTMTREQAIENGFGGFNRAKHIPIELTECERVTITVKTYEGDKITFAFVPGTLDPMGGDDFFEVVDIATHKEVAGAKPNDNIKNHKVIVFNQPSADIRTVSGITAVLLGKHHYKK